MAQCVEMPGRPAQGRPVGLRFGPFFLIFSTLVPATTTHPKLVALVRNKQNMYGTWCKTHFIPEKLKVKMEIMAVNNERHLHMLCSTVVARTMLPYD